MFFRCTIWKKLVQPLFKVTNGDFENIRREYDVSLSDNYRGCKLQHLKKVFQKQNDYPLWVIKRVFKDFQNKQDKTVPFAPDNEEQNNNVKNRSLMLP